MSSKHTIRFLIFVVAVFLTCTFVHGNAVADTYNVNASVPYEAPTQAAVVSSPSSGAVFSNAQQTISGTCQVKNPPTIISVIRDTTTLGSTECAAGSFRLAVLLQIGQNNLIVRTANASGVYGPDSSAMTFVLEKPTVAQPLPSGVNEPATTESQQAATNEGGISGLQVTTETPYTVLPDTKVATIRVTVSGGQTPYVVQLKWGDGSIESRSLTQSGTYDFAHTYTTRKSYSVSVYVRDVLGAFTEYTYAVVSGVKTSGGGSVATDGKTSAEASNRSEPWRLIGVVWYYWILIIFAIIFLVWSYIFGYRHGHEQAETEAAQRAVATKNKRRQKRR